MNIDNSKSLSAILEVKPPNILLRGLVWVLSFVHREAAYKLLSKHTFYRIGENGTWRPLIDG